MSAIRVSIGQVKRDISELVNRVAYGGERIMLTSRGKPKAVIVSITDYEQLEQSQAAVQQAQWQAWLAEWKALHEEIMTRRQGQPIDVDALWKEVKADQEARDDQLLGA